MEGASLQPLLSKESRIRVSSTLDKSVGRKHLTDGNPETCWTSKQNLPQFVSIEFDHPVIPKVIDFTFQGGFVGTRCKLLGSPPASEAMGKQEVDEVVIFDQIFPEDNNRQQRFDLPGSIKRVTHLKLIFEESSDPFGRITMYNLQIYGTTVLEDEGESIS